MSILFLDIDGVIDNITGSQHDLDKDKVNLLIYIIQQTNCDIVITSDWRYGGIDISSQLQKSLVKAGGQIVYNHIIGSTITSCDCRSIQIHQWLFDNMYEGTYAILDDNEMFDDDLNYYLVKTEKKEGLTKAHTNNIIKILKGF
jgi:hypothetical protein